MTSLHAYPVDAEAPWEAKAREAADLAARAQKLLLEAEEAKKAAEGQAPVIGKPKKRVSISGDVDAAIQAKSALVEDETMKAWAVNYGAVETEVRSSDGGRSIASVLHEKFGISPALLHYEVALKPMLPLGLDGANGLAELLASGSLQRLELLTLSFSALGDAGTVALADAMTAHAPLQQLDLSGNSIQSAGTDALARALVRGAMPQLIKISLKNNDLNDEAAVALAGASHDALEWLNLSSNQIADTGGSALASALAANRFGKLRRLSLDHNRLGDAAMGALAAVLAAPEGSGLEELYVECNPATEEATRQVQQHFGGPLEQDQGLAARPDARAVCEEVSVSIYKSGCVVQ